MAIWYNKIPLFHYWKSSSRVWYNYVVKCSWNVLHFKDSKMVTVASTLLGCIEIIFLIEKVVFENFILLKDAPRSK